MLRLLIVNILDKGEKDMADWISKTLGEVTSFITKGIPPKYTEKESKNTIRVLNQKCNRNFEISYDESRLHDVRLKKVPENKYLQPGDVLINSTGTGTAGRVAQIFDVPVPTTIDGHMILIRPTKEIDFLYYGYAVKGNQKVIETLAEGSTGQTEVNRQRLQDEIVINFPKDKELQKEIGTLLFLIDEKIRNNNQINNNLAA
jgi:restriction endonuclease S subunit